MKLGTVCLESKNFQRVGQHDALPQLEDPTIHGDVGYVQAHCRHPGKADAV